MLAATQTTKPVPLLINGPEGPVWVVQTIDTATGQILKTEQAPWVAGQFPWATAPSAWYDAPWVKPAAAIGGGVLLLGLLIAAVR